ncbi:MAG: phage Gp37/Gp68 family protein [Oscillospiraceae bacterium]|nr:phage Gp37/Gp68 family protein [Oscillospiraceae bacterium]
MNKSKIDYVDFSWNPVTGCRHECRNTYCYASKQGRRFCGDIRANKTSPQIQMLDGGLYILDEPFRNSAGKVVPLPAGFEPTLHKYRLEMLSRKKKPANIFVGSMADVFGEWVPDEWITAVFDACAAAPWHKYLFLTKNPARYGELAEKGLLPDALNMWFGSTTTRQEDMFWWSKCHNTFVSIEPLMGVFEPPDNPMKKVDWVIIGAETGCRRGKVVPEQVWVENIVVACRELGTPVFMKKNLAAVWGEPLIQEYPTRLNAQARDNHEFDEARFTEEVPRNE